MRQFPQKVLSLRDLTIIVEIFSLKLPFFTEIFVDPIPEKVVYYKVDDNLKNNHSESFGTSSITISL